MKMMMISTCKISWNNKRSKIKNRMLDIRNTEMKNHENLILKLTQWKLENEKKNRFKNRLEKMKKSVPHNSKEISNKIKIIQMIEMKKRKVKLVKGKKVKRISKLKKIMTSLQKLMNKWGKLINSKWWCRWCKTRQLSNKEEQLRRESPVQRNVNLDHQLQSTDGRSL